MQPSNLEINRNFWDEYAKQWSKYNFQIPNDQISQPEKDSSINYLGDEWGTAEDVEEIISEYIFPFLTKNSTVAEIGVGGARIAAKVVENVEKLYCFDVAPAMLDKAKERIGHYPQVEFHLMENSEFEAGLGEKFDFIYSFDVFVHLDLPTIWKYLNSIYKILKEGGRAFIHTSSITTPNGWTRFCSKADSEQLYYPTSPEAIKWLIEKAEMTVIKESTPDGNNFYLERDYLVVIQKYLNF
ncbi:class I SAM-dependent methyltransferase [Nostoc sp.]